MKQFFFIITLVVALPGLAAEKKSAPVNPKQVSIPKKILFVGNSFTYWNKGLWHHMEQLVQCRPEKLDFEAERVVRGGASLKVMWGKTKAPATISEGDYDVVVLQEDIPETDVKSFYKFARKFDSSVRKSGPGLCSLWPGLINDLAGSAWKRSPKPTVRLVPSLALKLPLSVSRGKRP